jgi:hypothetical protein
MKGKRTFDTQKLKPIIMEPCSMSCQEVYYNVINLEYVDLEISLHFFCSLNVNN